MAPDEKSSRLLVLKTGLDGLLPDWWATALAALSFEKGAWGSIHLPGSLPDSAPGALPGSPELIIHSPKREDTGILMDEILKRLRRLGCAI
jgi:hypothetical protein